LGPGELKLVRGAFNDAVMKVFILPIVTGAVSLVLSLGMEMNVMEDGIVEGQRW
jgi:hypothetical protein